MAHALRLEFLLPRVVCRFRGSLAAVIPLSCDAEPPERQASGRPDGACSPHARRTSRLYDSGHKPLYAGGVGSTSKEDMPMDHACSCGHHATPEVLDVREVPPKLRHPMIFEMFDTLATGAAFVLVNDHDPKPLFYQFQHERAGAFGWRYLEDGPDTWRVEISKRAPAAARVDPTETVADVLGRSPATDAVFARFGIDRCCGGRLTLREAAATAGIAVETLTGALEAALAPTVTR